MAVCNGPLQFGSPVRALQAVTGFFRMPCHNISLVNQQSQHAVNAALHGVVLYVHIQ
jgi:hypothetical protein